MAGNVRRFRGREVYNARVFQPLRRLPFGVPFNSHTAGLITRTLDETESHCSRAMTRWRVTHRESLELKRAGALLCTRED